MKVNYAKNYTNKYNHINNNLSYKALPYSNIKIKGLPDTDIVSVFRLTHNDLNFINKFQNKLNLTALATKSRNKQNYKLWQDVIESALEKYKQGVQTFIITRQNKACGIVTYSNSQQDQGYYVDFIASWPIKKNESTKCGGKILMNAVINEAIKNKKKNISLVPINLQIKDKKPDEFYERIGMLRDIFFYKFPRRKYKKTLQNFKKDFTEKIIDKTKEINLEEFIKID